jgi:extracellular elastinolytic metalloproteinase
MDASPQIAARHSRLTHPARRASYVRLRVLSNQCTGQALYHGDLDDDPGNDADCTTGSTQDDNVRAAELQGVR